MVSLHGAEEPIGSERIVGENELERVQEGNAYYFRLEGQEGKTFYAYSSIIPEVRWSAKIIKVSFNKTDSDIIAISNYQKVE